MYNDNKNEVENMKIILGKRVEGEDEIRRAEGMGKKEQEGERNETKKISDVL